MASSRRSLKSSAAATLLSLIAALVIATAPQTSRAAGPTPSGPAAPPPGGVTSTTTPAEGAPPNDGFIGKAGGSTVTYSAFGSGFSHMWWGPDEVNGPNLPTPAFAFDGAIDTASEHLSLFTTSGSTAIWGAGTSTLKYISGGTYTNKTVNTRYRMVATRVSDNSPISWVSAPSVGIATGVGAVIPVPFSGSTPQSFKVMRIFEACAPSFTLPSVASCNTADGNWEPVNDLYNRLNTDPAVRTISSIGTGFYYNRIPTVNGAALTTNEDTNLPLTLSATDADGNPLTYTIVSGPSNGTLTGSGASRTYIPNANYNGADSFVFKVNDGFVDSATATVSITINPVNDAPVATAQTVSIDEDNTLPVTLTGTDVENDPLTFEIVGPPAHGTLDTSSLPTVLYTPELNYNGPDSFTFRAKDAPGAYSVPATIGITVNPVNDAPVAQDLTVGTDEDTARDITVVASDVDGDGLTYQIVDGPHHGTLTPVSGATFHYVPDENYNSLIGGDDTFTFTATDPSSAASNTATVTIQIPSVDDPPVAQSQSVTTDEDTSAPITLEASDVDQDSLDYIVVDGPSHGHLEGSGSSLVYVPDANYNGNDSFTFKAREVNDRFGVPITQPLESTVQTVSITVNAVNDQPVADAQSVTTAEDNDVPITLTASDVDGDALTYTYGQPSHGTLTGTAPDLVYHPDPNYNGPDSFTFTVSDGSLESETATVSITVTPVNDAPVADAQNVTTDEDTALAVVLTGSDVENDPLTFTIVTGPSHGTLEQNGAEITYHPFADYNGPDSFTFLTNDGELASNIATISITVNAVNDNPVAGTDAASTPQYTPITINVLANDTDVDLDAISVVSATAGAKGTTAVNPDGTITYSPTPQFKDSDAFSYVISDGNGGQAVGTVIINEIGCGEDGLDHAHDGPADGAVSGTIDRQVEPAVGGVDPDTAANLHAYNCAYVVPTENTIDEQLP